MSEEKERTKKYQKAGYRVHFARLKNIHAEVSAIRTHKFLCEIPKGVDIKTPFVKLANVVDSNKEGSILWFLIQMYGLGFCVAKTPEEKRKFLKVLDPRFKSPAEQIQTWLSEKNSEKTKKIISVERLFDFLLKAPRQPLEQYRRWKKNRETENVPTFVSDALLIFGISDFSELENDPLLRELFDNIFSELKENEGKKFLENLRTIFANFFEIPKLAKLKKEDTTTFFFNPYFWEKNGRKIDDKEFEIYEVLFKNIFPTANHLVEEPNIKKDPEKEIMGTANNQGGLSNFLNDALSTFQESEEKTKDIIQKQNPKFFEENIELLDTLAKKVFILAGKIKMDDEVDFIAKNWGDYRSLIGGRLEGWVSNFRRRLTELQSALSDSIHEKEFHVVDLKTGEIKEEQELEKFRFWGKGKEKGELQNRYNSASHCTKNILKTIRENTNFENVFPEEFRRNFEQLEKLQMPLLQKLRATVLGVDDKNPNENLGKMIDEYSKFWQPVNEFLAKWENEGIPSKIDQQEISIWDDTKQNPDSKPENFWIAKSLLANKKEESNDENNEDSDRKILGKWKKNFIPSELAKYPRFLYEAAKDPAGGIKEANEKLPKIIAAAEKFVSAVENQKDKNWEKENWETTVKNGEMKWPFGQFHKSLEALLKIAVRAKNQKVVINFLNSFVEWDEQGSFFKNLVAIRSTKVGFDEQKEKQKIEEVKNKWKNFVEEKPIDSEKLANFHFYLSGKEYGFARYAAIPTKMVSYADFLQRFEDHFELTKGRNFLHFLEVQNGGANDNSATKAELLKFWWARRIMNLAEKVNIPDFSEDEIFAENVLGKLVLRKSPISRYDVARFLQSGFGADIRAKTGTLSRKSFIARNVVQITNGSQTLLQFVPREWGEFATVQITGKTHAQRRRQKLAAQPLLQKLEKRLKRTQNNIATLSRQNQDFKMLGDRAELLEAKIQKLKNAESLGFSEKAKEVLRTVFGEGILQKTSVEIATEIWKKNANNQELGRVLGEMPHSWEMVLNTKQEIKNMEKIEEDILTFGKGQGGTFGIFDEESMREIRSKNADFYYSFPIQTSSIQKQFLERFLWGDRDGILTEKIMGSSVILEIEKLVKWEDMIPKIEDGETKMFVAIPFQFSKGKTTEIPDKRKLENTENTEIEITNSAGKSQKQYRREKNILGIDLGEYGFGWAIFNPQKNEFKKSGFVEVPLLQKMRDSAASWKDTQGSGIFSRPTTHLADIREKAAGTVRNQIHALALEYDAIPIYEDSVDGFESGGARISKLYKTLKTSDVIGGNSNAADKTVRKHFWGLDFAQIGGVIGAAKTSQTCRKCGRCATSEIENFAKIAEEGDKNGDKNQVGLFPADKKSLARKDGAKIFFEISEKKIVGTGVLCDLKNGEFEKSEILKVIKKAQRIESTEEKQNREFGKKRRGMVGKFKCQIYECENETDADEQAAKNIALKYFFKLLAHQNSDYQKGKFKTDGNFSSLKYFLEKSKDPKWRDL